MKYSLFFFSLPCSEKPKCYSLISMNVTFAIISRERMHRNAVVHRAEKKVLNYAQLMRPLDDVRPEAIASFT
jgi:hypothetical protein